MILYLLNQSFEKIDVIDEYVSIIWTTRFRDVGEFELYLPSNGQNKFECGQFIMRDDNDALMMIDDIKYTTDEETGDFCTVTGKSIENVLSYRIIWDKSELTGKIEESIYRLVDENAIDTGINDRNIPKLKCAKLKQLSDTGTFIYHGEYLIDVIKQLCETYNYGFKITMTNDVLVFEIYTGTDRSYNQNKNPFVIFSPEFDNLARTTYENSTSEYKNVCLAYGKTDNASGFVTEIVGNEKGLNRRETFVDGGNEGSEENFSDKLISSAKQALSAVSTKEVFEGEIESTYVYQEDYFLGDIVQIENEYGIKATVQIMEIIENEDESGYTCIPTFEVLEV